MRYAKSIEVGMHEHRVGFTIIYAEGDRAHFLFEKDVAKQLTERLTKLIADLDYLDRQMPKLPGDKIGLSDNVTIRLTPPSDPGPLGITQGDDVTT